MMMGAPMAAGRGLSDWETFRAQAQRYQGTFGRLEGLDRRQEYGQSGLWVLATSMQRPMSYIWSFVLAEWPDDPTRIPVEMRGRGIEGPLRNGDFVIVPGQYRRGQMLAPKLIINLSNGGARVVVHGVGKTGRIALVLFGAFALAIIAVILAIWGHLLPELIRSLQSG
jgi:hypothetical protein